MAADWGKIESDYMANRLTYREIAEKYGVSLSSVARHGRKNGWPEKREHFANKVNARARGKAEYKKAARRAETLMRLDELAERMLLELEVAMDDEEQLYRHVLYVAKGQQGERVLDKLDTRATKDMVETLRTLLEVIRDVKESPGRLDAERLKLQKERLRLDRERVAVGMAAEDETGVAMLASVVEEAEGDREMVLGGMPPAGAEVLTAGKETHALAGEGMRDAAEETRHGRKG
ncbi:MAG: hypothetical protein ACI4MJ_01140 [Aristaeellaceae bacterium]